MQFTVQQSEFANALGVVVPATEKKTTIPVLGNILVTASADGLVLTGTDLQVGVRVRCSAVVEDEGAITLPAKRLHEYVRLLPEGTVHVNAKDGWASIKAGKSRTRMAGLDAESFPQLPKLPKELLCDLPASVLSRLVSRVQFAVSSETSKFTLEAALLKLDSAGLTLVSTDGNRMPVATYALEGLPDLKVLLPLRAMGELRRLGLDGTNWRFAVDENHLFFFTESRQLIVRKQAGNFPDYERAVPREQKFTATAEVAGLKEALNRARLFSGDERVRLVRLHISQSAIGIKASALNGGEVEEEVEVQSDGEGDANFNAAFLLDFLNVVNAEKVDLMFSDSGAFTFREHGEDSYRYVAAQYGV